MVFKFSGTVFYTFFHHFSLALVFFSSWSVLALLGFLHLRRGFSKSSTKSKRNWLYVFFCCWFEKVAWPTFQQGEFSASGNFGILRLCCTTATRRLKPQTRFVSDLPDLKLFSSRLRLRQSDLVSHTHQRTGKDRDSCPIHTKRKHERKTKVKLNKKIKINQQ